MSSILEKIKEIEKDKTVLIVAHGGIVRLLNKIYNNGSTFETTQNGGIYEFNI